MLADTSESAIDRREVPFTPSLPTVTIVIINWNYGRFLPQAMQSVLAQDYQTFDCLIVDNGSTDDSRTIIDLHIQGDPRFQLVALDQNYGQLGALFKSFDRIKGDFVVILDADDILAPSFVSNHVQVHLALPKAVAFTSANVMEIDVDGHARTGGYQGFGPRIAWNSPGLVEPGRTIRVPHVSDDKFASLSARTSAILPWQMGWFWSPGSANMYRRSALKMVRQSRQPEFYRRAADGYLNPFCHAISGSALVDLPLSYYRIHDGNYFALQETMAGIQSGRPEFERIHQELAEEIVDFFLSASGRFRSLLGAERFWYVPDQIVLTLTGCTPFKSAAFARSVTRHFPALQRALGDEHLISELPPRLRPCDAAALFRSALFPKLSCKFAWRLASATKRQGNHPWLPRGFTDHRRPPRGNLPRDFGPIAVISMSPPIIKTGIAYEEWIGIAGAFGRRFGNGPAAFLIYPTWSIEESQKVAAIAEAAHEHCRRYPDHRLIYMGNTQRETDLLIGRGLTAVFLNKNFTVSDTIFRPLPEVEPEFDAIYNARFAPGKRYELAAAIESLAYLGYLHGDEDEMRAQLDILHAYARKNPHHVLLNPVVDGRPTRLSQEETNRALNRARIGLCLSAVEGTNYASMEYMLAGLGVVSTPSKGGRDVYFDKDYCIICEPEPLAVQKAVAEIKARQIPRDYIRKQTLARIQKERKRFLDLVDDLREQLGGVRKAVKEWPFGDRSGMVDWDHFEGHLQRLERGNAIAEIRAQTVAVSELLTSDSCGIQLEPAELLPIIRAILAVPHCQLLVFGCGNDSVLWEQVNGEGRTAILEDDQSWIDAVRPKLTRATIDKVDYGTSVADWPSQLDAGDRLVLELPESIKESRWDVVIVDGPAGYQDTLPGRSRSIVTAAHLVALGGKVFVHDCERPLERNFTARYLGEHRRFVTIHGRAQLNGYAF